MDAIVSGSFKQWNVVNELFTTGFPQVIEHDEACDDGRIGRSGKLQKQTIIISYMSCCSHRELSVSESCSVKILNEIQTCRAFMLE